MLWFLSMSLTCESAEMHHLWRSPWTVVLLSLGHDVVTGFKSRLMPSYFECALLSYIQTFIVKLISIRILPCRKQPRCQPCPTLSIMA